MRFLLQSPSRLRLQLGITVRHWSFWLPIAVGLSVIVVWLWLTHLPNLRRDLTQQAEQLSDLKRKRAAQVSSNEPPPPTPFPPVEDHLRRFERILGAPDAVPSAIRTLFALAKKNGLTLAEAEYQPSTDPQGGFSTMRITLPLKGSYAAIRQFALDTLMALPFASIDDIAFARKAIDEAQLESQLHLTLWLQPTPSANSVTAEGTR